MNGQGHSLHVAVNVSAADIRNPGFSQFVLKSIDRYKVAPEQLTLELTETAMMRDVEQCTKTLYALKKAGINIAIDDFGTGYSSLTYLANLPLHSLKIDQEFISGWETTPRSRSIVKSTINMANGLNLRTTAEGVESKIWLSELKELGCNEAQGYGIAKPMPLDDISGWLNDNAFI